MKKITLVIAFILSVIASFAQTSPPFPNNQSISNSSTLYHAKGGLTGDLGLVNARYPDTTTANNSYIAGHPGAQIIVGNTVYIRNQDATGWLTGTGTNPDTLNAIPGANISITGIYPNKTWSVTGVYTQEEVENLIHDSINNISVSNGYILNDSTFLLCNSGGCDTFVVQNISISSFTFTSDSTVLVCNTAGSCDTITFAPIVLNKFYVDSVKIVSGAVDTIKYFINGVSYVGGVVNRFEPTSYVSDGLITPGYVTWLHDSTFFVTSATYIKNFTLYTSVADSITVSGIDATYPVKFVFVVDTTGHAGFIAGTPAAIPLDPQIDPASQIQLTSGITFNAGSTTPANITVVSVYNENLGTPSEFNTGSSGTISVNYNNTTTPFDGVKNADVGAYTKNSQLTYTDGVTHAVADQILIGRVYLKIPLANKNALSFRYYNGATAVSSAISVRNTFGLDPSLVGQWQTISIPMSAFTWSSQSFNKIGITMTNGASNGFKMDKIEFQSGLQNIPPQTDYSNKVDSVNYANGNFYWWANGISHFIASRTDTALINNWIRDSMLVIENNSYTSNQIDSIVTVIRQEIVDASGGGVVSVAKGWGIVQDGTITSSGTITADSVQLAEFFIRRMDTIPINKLPISPIYVIHKGQGYQTVYADSTDSLYNKMIKGDYPMSVKQNSDSSLSAILAIDSLPQLEYAPAGRDTTLWNERTLIDKGYLSARLAAFVTGGITRAELQDTAANIRAYSYPLVGNPSGFLTSSSITGKLNISDTASMLSPYLRAAVANATFANKATTISINGVTQDLSTNRSWTVSSGGGKDSSAFHTSQIIGDSLLVICDLKGRCDTIAMSFVNLWSKNGSKIYYNTGNVGIGTIDPSSKLEVRSNMAEVANLTDSNTVILSNTDSSTNTIKPSPYIIFTSYGYLNSGRHYKSSIRMGAISVTGSSLSRPNFYIEGSVDGGAYTTLLTLTASGGIIANGGSSTFGGVNGSFATFSSSVTAGGLVSTSYTQSPKVWATTRLDVGTTTPDYSAINQNVSTNQGLLPPRMTMVQRDSINLVVTGATITNGGSYSGTPSVNFSTTNSYVTATGTAVKTGSAVTSITITNGGNYYKTPAITFSGGTGSGATATAIVTQQLTTGLTIFCTDCTATDSSTGVMQTWNGTSWKNNW